MKKYINNSILWGFTGFLLIALSACKKEETPIPTPSTQALFGYTIESFYQDEASGEMFYEVNFVNNSVYAASYLWDFGDGNTSTDPDPGIVIFEGSGIYDVTLTITPMSDQEGLHYNNLDAAERLLLVPTIFEERFDDMDLANSFPPEGWLLIDADGDGANWYWDEFEGEFYILSRSYDGVPITPDNWIITPEIDLTDITASIALEWDVAPTANTPAYRQENYSVLVSTTGTNPEDFTTVFTERLEPDMDNWVWMLRNIDLSEYAGETIHIAFRHHDSTDFDRIALTNIHLFQTGN